MARFAWAVSGFLHPLSCWLIGFRVPVIAGNVCELFFWRSSSTVVMLRSAWSVWFETYRGAPSLTVLMFWCYAEVCVGRLVRDVPWRTLAISLNVLVLYWRLHGAFGSRRTVARLLTVLIFWCYADVCMERLVRDVPWRALAISLNVLDWNLWMLLTFDSLEQPHNSMP